MNLKPCFDRAILHVESQYKHLVGIYYSLSEVPEELKELNVYKEIKQFFDANGVCLHINQMDPLVELTNEVTGQNYSINGIAVAPFLHELLQLREENKQLKEKYGLL